MAPGYDHKILNIAPHLPKRPAPPRPDYPAPSAGNDFLDMVDDAPSHAPDQVRKTARVTVTWKIFFAMLLTGLAIGLMAMQFVFLFLRDVPHSHALPIGLVAVAACMLTAYVNYRVLRLLAGRLLTRVVDQTREMFAIPPHAHLLQASEIDRLDDALLHLLSGVKFQFDSQKRIERNDLIQTITALATALEARDPYTRNHSRSVARLTVRLGAKMGLSRDFLYDLHLAGLLHDIGKIGVPDGILLKPTRLTEEEMRTVEGHVVWSYNILNPIKILGQVGTIVRHHHERYDGKGYPDRLAGEQIPFGSRVISVVDMFMAMTEDRPYRKGLPVEAAIKELRRVSGAQLDPHCVAEFLELLASDGLVQASGPEPEVEVESKRAAAN